jgi:hypothetical protein
VGVQQALDDLDVRYLVLDPQLSGGEADFARQSLESLVTTNASDWTLRFTSTNGKHRVFERIGARPRGTAS